MFGEFHQTNFERNLENFTEISPPQILGEISLVSKNSNFETQKLSLEFSAIYLFLKFCFLQKECVMNIIYYEKLLFSR